ncbi:flagellar basal body-associated protein FliL [Veronia pacifica]|uniref:Flagellar protein FliL n=1 Tax=Veronia pacifica TaxID=1080227 RepID=A0A1C3EEE4_9GAMM|nr:flagellar basal body-associated protein FliL [Veronia pacifica]ODA31608.1 flagellar basal body-associated protein FliL [Veronia pacifica]
MAEEETENTEEEGGGGKSKLLIIIIAAVVLLAGGGGAAFFLMSGGDEAPPEATASQEKTESDAPPAPALYVTLDQPFIFNVTGDRAHRLVQVEIQLMVRGESHQFLVQQNLPLVESSLLEAFGKATVQQLRTAKGQDEVRQMAAESVQKAMENAIGEAVVERVLFTGFVMQ